MRRYYCDRCSKEVKQDTVTKAPKLYPLFLLLQEQDLAKNAIATHDVFSIEVCGDCHDEVVEDGHDVVNAFKAKATNIEKTKKTTS